MIKPITGTFFEFDHHNRPEGKYYNETMWAFSESQWRAKVRETAEIGMDTLGGILNNDEPKAVLKLLREAMFDVK